MHHMMASYDDSTGDRMSKAQFRRGSPESTPVQGETKPCARKEGRRRTLFSGMLASCSGAFTINCTVTNFSMSGARVRVDPGALLSGKVWLVHLREKLAFETRIAWRDACDIGLEFIQAHDLSGATRADLKTLRRYCIDHGPSLLVMDESREPAKPSFGARR